MPENEQTESRVPELENMDLRSMTIAERVRAARIAVNKTQQQLAGDTFSKSYISAIERGKMTPSIQALGILAERLNLPLSYFFGESGADLETLAATIAALRPSPEHGRKLREEAASLNLAHAEGLLRQNKADEVLSLFNAVGEPPEDLPLNERPRWYWLSGRALIRKQRFQEAMPVLEKGLNLADTLHSQNTVSQKLHLAEMREHLRNLIGGCYYELSRPEMALVYHRQCLAAISDGIVADPELKLLIFKSLGNDYFALGRYQDAITFYTEASKLAEDMNEPRQQGLTYWGLAIVQRSSGNLGGAKANFQKALAIFEALDNARLVSELRSMFGEILIRLQQYDVAEKNLRQSLGAAERSGDNHTRGLALMNFAALHQAKGDLEKAVRTAEDGLKVIKETGDFRTEGQLYLTLASVYETRKETQASAQTYMKAIQTFEQTQDRELLGRAHEAYGKFLAEQGRFREAFEQMHLARIAVVHQVNEV